MKSTVTKFITFDIIETINVFQCFSTLETMLRIHYVIFGWKGMDGQWFVQVLWHECVSLDCTVHIPMCSYWDSPHLAWCPFEYIYTCSALFMFTLSSHILCSLVFDRESVSHIFLVRHRQQSLPPYNHWINKVFWTFWENFIALQPCAQTWTTCTHSSALHKLGGCFGGFGLEEHDLEYQVI